MAALTTFLLIIMAAMLPSAILAQTTLSALAVSPKNINGFAADRLSYAVGIANTLAQATVTPTAGSKLHRFLQPHRRRQRHARPLGEPLGREQ